MKVTDTIIKWHIVNMRSTDKDLPEQGKTIIYFNNGIYNSIVRTDAKGNLCVNVDFKKQYIKSGFLWCYQKDISIPQELA